MVGVGRMNRLVCTVKGSKRAHESSASRKIVSLRKRGGGPNLISERVRVIDANCSHYSKQGEAERFDFCQVKIRGDKGKIGHRRVVDLPGTYEIGTVFIAAYPKKAYRD